MNAPEDIRKDGLEPDEVHLLDYLIVLAKHSRAILLTPILAAALTFIVLLFFPNQYTSTARLFPPQQNLTMAAQLISLIGISDTISGGASGSGLGNLAAGVLGLKSPADVYVGILTGNTIFDNIIKRFNLKEVYDEEYIEDARAELAKRADITVSKEGLITINVTDKDRQRAAAMANAFMEELNALLQRVTEKEAKDYLAFLERELQQTAIKLAAAEDSLREFSEKSNVLQIDNQTKAMLEYIASIRAAIDTREVQIKVLRQQATPYNYDVIRLETEVKELREKLKAAECRIDANYVGDVCLPTSKVPSLGLEYFRLLREVKYQEGIYQVFAKLVEIARIDTVRSVSNINIVDNAILAEQKSKPKRGLISAIVGVLTFFIMIFSAFVWEGWQRVQEAGDAERFSQLRLYMAPWKDYYHRIRRLFRRQP